MTDRAQPGAIDSIIRNNELGEALGQFSDGWVVPASEPTRSAQRYGDLDETAFSAFDESSSGSSLTVTIGPGEAFVDGWVATDTATDVDLAANTADQTVVVSWDPDAVYDPQTDATRDDADDVVIDLDANVDDLDPALPLWAFDTDGSGVTGVVDERDIGSAISTTALEAKDTLTDPAGVSHTGRLADGPVLGAFVNMQVFEADGTFDASSIDLAYVEVVGGGGSGGVQQDGQFITPIGAGGGGGGYAAGYVDVSAVDSVSVTVGSGGDVVSPSSGGSNNGFSSSFGSYLSATGGSGGGTGEFATGGSGGSGTGGSLNVDGGRGEGQGREDESNIASGGGSMYSAGEGGVFSSNATNAEGFGGGGAGGGDGRAGAGSGGAVIVRY